MRWWAMIATKQSIHSVLVDTDSRHLNTGFNSLCGVGSQRSRQVARSSDDQLQQLSFDEDASAYNWSRMMAYCLQFYDQRCCTRLFDGVNYSSERHMKAIIPTVVFDRKDCYNDAERDVLAIAKFLVMTRLTGRCINPLLATLKPQSNRPLYSNTVAFTVIGTLAVDRWAVTFGKT